MGLTGLRVPERFGGQEADAVTTGMAAEEISRSDFNACYVLLTARWSPTSCSNSGHRGAAGAVAALDRVRRDAARGVLTEPG